MAGLKQEITVYSKNYAISTMETLKRDWWIVPASIGITYGVGVVTILAAHGIKYVGSKIHK